MFAHKQETIIDCLKSNKYLGFILEYISLHLII